MRTLRVLLTLLAASLVLGVAPAPAEVGEHCHKVKAVGVGEDLGGGDTVATITRAGFLNGTTAAHFDITGGAIPVLTFAGTVTFTAKKGTLTVAIAGTFDISTGAFEASGPVTAGTGRFADASGTLVFSGMQTGTDFTETVTGTLCLVKGGEQSE